MQDRDTEIRNQTPGERKPWQAPHVIVSEIQDAEANPGAGGDGSGRS